jgi:hypothetical protein
MVDAAQAPASALAERRPAATRRIVIAIESVAELIKQILIGQIKPGDIVICARCDRWIGPTNKLAPHWLACEGKRIT